MSSTIGFKVLGKLHNTFVIEKYLNCGQFTIKHVINVSMTKPQ